MSKEHRRLLLIIVRPLLNWIIIMKIY